MVEKRIAHFLLRYDYQTQSESKTLMKCYHSNFRVLWTNCYVKITREHYFLRFFYVNFTIIICAIFCEIKHSLWPIIVAPKSIEHFSLHFQNIWSIFVESLTLEAFTYASIFYTIHDVYLFSIHKKKDQAIKTTNLYLNELIWMGNMGVHEMLTLKHM